MSECVSVKGWLSAFIPCTQSVVDAGSPSQRFFPCWCLELVPGEPFRHQPEDATLLVNALAVCCAKPDTLASSTDGEGIWVGDGSGQGLGLGSIDRVVRSVLLESPNI